MEKPFGERNVKLLGMSANTLNSHEKWIEDIRDISGCTLNFPIIADKNRKISYLYDMIDYQDTRNVDSKGMALTIRAAYFIDPKKIIRAIINYPASTGRNSQEILRVIDSLQLTDKYNLVTPIDWKVKSSVISLNSSKWKRLLFTRRSPMTRHSRCSPDFVQSNLTFAMYHSQRIENVKLFMSSQIVKLCK